MATVTDFTEEYDVRSNTIRQWAKVFADFLEPGANPEKGETRVFSDDDGRVIALVAKMRQDNQSYEKIRAALADGDRGPWPPISADTAQDAPGQQENTFALVTQLTAKASQLEGELGAIRNERDHLRQQVETAQDARRQAENHAVSLETELRILKELTEDKTPQGEKTAVPQDDDKPGFWARIFGR